MKKIKLLSVTLLLSLCVTMSAQTVSVEDVQVKAGQQSAVIVKLQGISNCIAAGFSLVLPNGAFKVNNSDLGYGATLDESFVADHIVVSNQLNNRTVKAAIYSPTNSIFQGGWISTPEVGGPGDSGESSGGRYVPMFTPGAEEEWACSTTLLCIDFMAYDMEPGVYQGQVKNIELAFEDYQLLSLPDVSFIFSVEDFPTDILEVDTNLRKEDFWYDLNGRKLPGKPNIKGLYIKNGHKVVIK